MPVLPEVGSMMTLPGFRTPLAGVVDHGAGHAILHAAGGVEILQLGKDPGLQAELLLDMGQLQQRRLADELVSGGVNMGHNDSPFLRSRQFAAASII